MLKLVLAKPLDVCKSVKVWRRAVQNGSQSSWWLPQRKAMSRARVQWFGSAVHTYSSKRASAINHHAWRQSCLPPLDLQPCLAPIVPDTFELTTMPGVAQAGCLA